MMNNPEVAEYSTAFACRLVSASADRDDRIRAAFLLAYCRQPMADEVADGRQYLDAYSAQLAKKEGVDPAKPLGPSERAKLQAAAKARDLAAWTSYAHILLMSNEFFYVD